METQLVTRKDAQSKGLLKYYTGKICKHGHYAWRYTKSGMCCDCATTTSKSNYSAPVKRSVLNAVGLVVIELRASERHKVAIDNFAFALTKARFPKFEHVDVCPLMAGYNGCGAGTFMYRYHVHCEDAKLVRDYALTLLSVGAI